MALTAQEEALVRQLLEEQAAILSLANSEATILSKLGATKVTLSDLAAVSTVADADLMLMRQGTTDRAVSAALLGAYAAALVPAASETVQGKIEIATAAESQGLTDLVRALTPGRLASAFQGSNQTLSANGYQRLPGGVILQWGTTASIASNASSGTITYPIAFPTNAGYVNYIGNAPVTGGANTNPTLATKTTSSFSFVNAYLSTVAFNWIAIGY